MKMCLPPGLTQICDAYSLEMREYFFNRSPRNFNDVLGLYRTGKLQGWESFYKLAHLAFSLFSLFQTICDRFACKNSARSWTTGVWMICTWSPAVSIATTTQGGFCQKLTQRWFNANAQGKVKICIYRKKNRKTLELASLLHLSGIFGISLKILITPWQQRKVITIPSKSLILLQQIVAIVSCLFVVVSTLCLIFSTLPAFQQKDGSGKISRK